MKPRVVRCALFTLIAVVSAVAGQAQAQTWPDKPITFIVPFAAGGGTDAFARPLAAQLDAQLGKRVLIENRAGAGGTVGASAAAKAAPDGYTFFMGAAHHAIAPSLYPNLDYNIEKDFIAVALIARPPQVVVVNPDKVAAKTLAEFIAYAKANPGKLNYGSAGAGTTHHLAGELFKILTKTNIQHVPYRGAGPAMQDLIAGHVPVVFDGLGSSAAPVRAGQLRALAVAAPKRVPAFPDLPTAAEAGLAGYEVSTWYGLFAPKNTPPAIVAADGQGIAEGHADTRHQGSLGTQRLRCPRCHGSCVRENGVRGNRALAQGRDGSEREAGLAFSKTGSQLCKTRSRHGGELERASAVAVCTPCARSGAWRRLSVLFASTKIPNLGCGECIAAAFLCAVYARCTGCHQASATPAPGRSRPPVEAKAELA